MEIIVFFIELFTICFILYIAFKLFRKKKIPRVIVIVNLFVIVLFWYLEYLVDEKEISFLGRENSTHNDFNQKQDQINMGAGLGWLYNRFILSGIFLLTQIIFFIFFRIKYNQINRDKKIKQPGQLL